MTIDAFRQGNTMSLYDNEDKSSMSLSFDPDAETVSITQNDFYHFSPISEETISLEEVRKRTFWGYAIPEEWQSKSES
jgi:hypothetical protein